MAHGRNSGEKYATSFSNREGSFKSSLGFYKTENTYYGKNGYSLVLDGLERGINDKAKELSLIHILRELKREVNELVAMVVASIRTKSIGLNKEQQSQNH